MITDMTKGKIGKTLLLFSIPLLLSVMFQQIYNIADSMIAGRILGEKALAAVGNSYEITLIFMAFAIGCNVGCSVIVSQLFGAKKICELKTAVHTTFIACAVLSLVLTACGLIFLPMLLSAINTPKEIYADSVKYMNIYIYGILFLMLYNICTGIFTALGDSRTPLIFLICSSLANIYLDYAFLKYLHMGVEGVAWATFLAQGAAFVLSLLTLLKKLSKFTTEEKPKLFSFFILGKIAVVAIPSILQQSFVSVGNILIQSLINSAGASVIAGYASAVKLNNFVITSFSTLANGISTFTAQNIGAQQFERIRKGHNAGLLIGFTAVLPFIAAYVIFAPYGVRLFVENPTPLALKSGSLFLRIIPPFYLLIVIKLITDGVLKGCGAMRYFMISTFFDLIVRVVLAFIFAEKYGWLGIWYAWPIGWILGAALSWYFFQKGVWRKKALI